MRKYALVCALKREGMSYSQQLCYYMGCLGDSMPEHASMRSTAVVVPVPTCYPVRTFCIQVVRNVL